MATRAQIIIPIAAAAFIVGIVGMLNIPSDAKLESVEFPMGTIKLDGEILQVQIADNDSLRITVKSEYPDSFGCSILAQESSGNYVYPTCTSSSSGGAGVWDQSTWDNSVFGD